MIREQNLPEDADSRSQYPLDDGLFGYFAAALLEVSRVSKIGNDQHNPGQPMHWDRSKSRDHGNKIMRHQLDAGKLDNVDGTRHSAKVAWRALAQLQEELEREGAPIARNARNADTHDHLKANILPAPVVERAAEILTNLREGRRLESPDYRPGGTYSDEIEDL